MRQIAMTGSFARSISRRLWLSSMPVPLWSTMRMIWPLVGPVTKEIDRSTKAGHRQAGLGWRNTPFRRPAVTEIATPASARHDAEKTAMLVLLGVSFSHLLNDMMQS